MAAKRIPQLDPVSAANVDNGDSLVLFDAGADETKRVLRSNLYGAGDGSAAIGYNQGGTNAVDRNVLDRLRDSVSVKDFGAVGDGVTDNTTAIQAALDYCMGNNKALFFPAGTYLTQPGLVALTSGTPSSGNLILFGEEGSARRHYDMPSRIVFTDDGNTTGGIGLDSNYSAYFKYLQFDTQGGDTRNKTGDFIGYRGPGGSFCAEQCIFLSCSGAALKLRDIGYASMADCIFRYNNIGLEEYLVNWPASTTGSFVRVHGFQNVNVFKCPTLNHSSWKDCIWEYNSYGVNTFAQNCEFINCYAEANYIYGAYSGSTRGAVFIGNYSNSPTDAFVATGSTTNFGFDGIGASIINQNSAQLKQIKFYDRSGNDAEVIKASNTGFSGVTVIENTAGDVVGVVPKQLAAQVSGYADQTIMFMVKGGSVYGSPSGWTITKTGTGVWRIDWPSLKTGSVRWPFIQAQGIPVQSTSVGPGNKDILAFVRARDSGTGVWNAFANMNIGFEIRIYDVDPTTGVMTAADEGAMVQVCW
jgi:hypothetical protein